MGKTKRMVLILSAGLLLSGTAQSALHDRGGGLLYDDVLNITWLQDANYAKTSGYDADGRMDWRTAKAWAENLIYFDSVRGVRYGGIYYSDWRLPQNAPVGTNWSYVRSPDGSTDVGSNITSEKAELAYMYYVNLALKGDRSPSNVLQSDFGIFRDGTHIGQADVGLVQNLQAHRYWYATPSAINPDGFAWGFDFGWGDQAVDYNHGADYFAWAVRDGDVAVVPEPEVQAMLLAGLAVVGHALRMARK